MPAEYREVEMSGDMYATSEKPVQTGVYVTAHNTSGYEHLSQ